MNPGEPLQDRLPVTMAAAFLEHYGMGKASWKVDAGGIERPIKTISHKIRYWRGDFYRWEKTHYKKLLNEEFEGWLTSFLASKTVFTKNDAKSTTTPLHATYSEVSNASLHLRSICQAGCREMPAWLNDRDVDTYHEYNENIQDATQIIAFKNGLLDVVKWLELADTEPVPHTPKWFSEVVLPCNWEPSATCPKWLNFLDKSLRGDETLISILQEWFGYCLTGDTKYQRMLWPHGDSGTGKSTMITVLQHLVGNANTASFNLWDLAERFTLQSWLGKRLVCSADAELGRSTEAMKVLARLKGIIGGDGQNIDRKNREALALVKLTVRLVISTNEFPTLPDASDTMLRRVMFIPFENKIDKANIDNYLSDRLITEIDGIAAWALEGLKRLERNGDFTDSKRSNDVANEYRRMQNPIFCFVEDCCDVSDDHEKVKILIDDIYKNYCKWAENNGKAAFSKEGFGQRLKRVVPTIKRGRRGKPDSENEMDDDNKLYRKWEIRGIQMSAEWMSDNLFLSEA